MVDKLPPSIKNCVTMVNYLNNKELYYKLETYEQKFLPEYLRMLTHLQDNPCEENLIKVFDSIIKRFIELKEYEHFEVP